MAPMGNIVAETRIIQGEKVHVKAGQIEIVTKGNNPCYGAQVIVDGVKLEKVRKITVTFEAGKVPTAEVELLVYETSKAMKIQ